MHVCNEMFKWFLSNKLDEVINSLYSKYNQSYVNFLRWVKSKGKNQIPLKEKSYKIV